MAGAEMLDEPGMWPENHAAYDSTFVRDANGDSVEAVCHGPGWG